MKLIKRIGLFLSIVILLLSSFKIVGYFNESRDNKEIYKTIKKEYYNERNVDSSLADDKTINNKDNSKIKDLKDINENIVAWLTVPGTNIDYPVVKGDNNEFYLNHDINNHKSIHGSIFMDYRNSIKEDKNLVIYGHHMKDGTMFKELTKYKSLDFFKQNTSIFMDIDGEKYEYEIFSVTLTPGDSGYIDTNFESQESFLDYIDKINKDSLFKRDINFKGHENIITLSTCSYEFDNARTVIFGVKKDSK